MWKILLLLVCAASPALSAYACCGNGPGVDDTKPGESSATGDTPPTGETPPTPPTGETPTTGDTQPTGDTLPTRETPPTGETPFTGETEATGATGPTDGTSGHGCGVYPPRCGINEVYNNCTYAGCAPQRCSELGFPLKCDKCKPRCVCKDGYVRDGNGVCIPINDCPSCGGDKNAQRGCGNYCGQSCSDYNKPPRPCPLFCIFNGCNCRPGFVYDYNVKACVRPKDCTPVCQANEQYSLCVNGGCVARNCNQISKPVPCAKLAAGSCIKGCTCVDGYLRAANGTCVPKDQCPPTCGKNANWQNCSGCSNQTCSTIGASAPGCPGFCISGCRCKPGFWRLEITDNDCVPENECPTPSCPDGEIYSRCPTVKCDGDYCPKTRDSPQTCPSGLPRCDKRCVCSFNRKRDRKTGKCIPITDCPPFKCGRNEEYQACPAFCPGENCTDYINKSRCPPGRIGIVLNCRPACKCIKGYYRNSEDVCIPACDCPGETTSTSTTIAPDSGSSGSSDRGTGLTGILDGITAFSGRFLYNRITSGALENIIISAMSVFTPIAELCLYSEGTAYDQCIKILNLQNKEDIRKTFPAFTSSYEDQSKVNFTTAAKIYANDIIPLSDALLKDVTDVFYADAEDIDFSNNVLAAKIINAWVESKTNNRIQDLISSDALSALTRLVLVNAIYFKGAWLNQFDPKNTQEDDFYLNDGTTKKVKLMSQLRNFNYGEVPELNCTAAELFYEGRNFSMVVVLPNSYDGVVTLAKNLQDPVNWNKIRGSLASARVELYLPPFEINTTTDLKELMRKVNLINWFDPKNSGLKGITKKEEEVYVSSAIQKAFMKTDETGSEAAAANAVIVGVTSVFNPEPPKKFRCDHSFLYYLLFKNTTIFSGAVVNP